ncbi:MAG: hypothetical protein ABL901_12855 [Hyphomicrobiaceae bacterium]
MAGFPWRLMLLTLLMLGVGGAMFVFAYRDQRAFFAMRDQGTEVVADIVDAFGRTNKGTTSYSVKLSWVDKRGQVQTYRPTHVSAGFWRTISTDNVWTVKTTRVRYLEGENVRPLIVGDMAEREYQDRFGIWAGLGFSLVGLVCGYFLVRTLRGRDGVA